MQGRKEFGETLEILCTSCRVQNFPSLKIRLGIDKKVASDTDFEIRVSVSQYCLRFLHPLLRDEFLE